MTSRSSRSSGLSASASETSVPTSKARSGSTCRYDYEPHQRRPAMRVWHFRAAIAGTARKTRA
jgi:hypothetical protein